MQLFVGYMSYELNTLNSQVMGTWLLLCSHLGNLEAKVNAASNSITFSTTTAIYKLYINICLFSGFTLTLLFTDTACLAFELVQQSPLKWTIFNLNESNIGVLKFWQIGNTMKMSLFFSFIVNLLKVTPHPPPTPFRKANVCVQTAMRSPQRSFLIGSVTHHRLDLEYQINWKLMKLFIEYTALLHSFTVLFEMIN